MSLFHFQANVVQRSKGRSSVAAAAYRAGTRLHDERTNLTFDYSNKREVGNTFLVGWSGTRSELWNAAEASEKRKDSTTAREYEIALPSELNASDRLELAYKLATHINDKYKVAVDACFHNVDSKNPHVHMMMTTREICPITNKFGNKSIVDISYSEQKKRGLNNSKVELEELKKTWCLIVNTALEQKGFNSRIDHRSLKDQGIDREPQIKHYNNAERIKENDIIKQRNNERERIKLELNKLYLEQEQLQLQSCNDNNDNNDNYILHDEDDSYIAANIKMLKELEAEFAREDALAEAKQQAHINVNINNDLGF